MSDCTKPRLHKKIVNVVNDELPVPWSCHISHVWWILRNRIRLAVVLTRKYFCSCSFVLLAAMFRRLTILCCSWSQWTSHTESFLRSGLAHGDD